MDELFCTITMSRTKASIVAIKTDYDRVRNEITEQINKTDKRSITFHLVGADEFTDFQYICIDIACKRVVSGECTHQEAQRWWTGEVKDGSC